MTKKLLIISTMLLLLTCCSISNKYKNKPFINRDTAKDITVEKAQKALKDGANINAKDYDDQTSLMLALKYSKDVELIKFLLKSGAKISDRSGVYKHTPLVFAIKANQNPEVINLLINAGAKVDDEDDLHLTPLNFALQNNNPEVIKLLLNKGAIVSNDSIRNAILHKQPFEIISLLQKAGAKPITQDFFTDYKSLERYKNYHGNDIRFTDLINAVKDNRSIKVINLLLNAGSKVSLKDNGGITALTSAVRYETHPEVIQALIKAGSDVNYNLDSDYTRDDENINTPLKNAIKYQQPVAVINMLIKAGAKMSVMDKSSSNTLLPPLMYALKVNKNPEIIQALLKAKAPLRYKDDEVYNDTPLSYAIEYNQPMVVVKMLIKAGAKVNRKVSKDNIYALTPLSYAIQTPKNPHSLELIKLFLKLGSKKNLNEDFLYAIDYGQSLDVIKLLLKSGVNIKKIEENNSLLVRIVTKGKKSDVEIVKFLLKAGSRVNLRDKSDDSPLVQAIDSHDDVEIIQALLDGGANVNPKCYRKPLLEAIDKGESIETIKLLLKAGANVLAHYDSTTPFVYANNRKKDSAEVIQLLAKYLKAKTGKSKAFLYEYNIPTITVAEVQQAIKSGSNVNSKNIYGQLPLFLAIKFKRPKIAQLLLESGAKANVILKSTNHFTPLMLAVKQDALETTKALLANGANINTPDGNGRSPLIVALQQTKDVELIQLLLKSGAKVITKDRPSDQPLFLAINHHQKSTVIQALLQAGADVHIKDEECQQTPLIQAVGENDSIQTIEVLLKAGANPSFKDCKNLTPILFAVKNRQTATDELNVVKLLIKSGATPNVVNTHGINLLTDMVQSHKSTDLIQALIDGGADVNQKLTDGTPLLMSMITDKKYMQNLRYKDQAKTGLKNTIKIIKMFVKAGANINAQNSQGQTLLMSSIIHYVPNDGRTLVLFQALLKAGADVNIADNKGKTPLIYAANMTYHSRNAYKVLEAYSMAHALDGLVQNHGTSQIDNLQKQYNIVSTNFGTLKETIIKLLLKNKANINVQDKEGNTPLSLAQGNHSSSDVIHLLQN